MEGVDTVADTFFVFEYVEKKTQIKVAEKDKREKDALMLVLFVFKRQMTEREKKKTINPHSKKKNKQTTTQLSDMDSKDTTRSTCGSKTETTGNKRKRQWQ